MMITNNLFECVCMHALRFSQVFSFVDFCLFNRFYRLSFVIDFRKPRQCWARVF